MDTIECIKSRRSRRDFLNKDIDLKEILNLIEIACYAPFSGPPIAECQPWKFIIIKDKIVKENIAKSYSGRDKNQILNCSAIVAVCADVNRDPDYKDYEASCALACQNLLLALHDKGYGGCYMTSYNHNENHEFDRKNLIKSLKLPDDIRLIALIPIGYPNEEEIVPEKEIEDINKIVHYDTWS